MRKAEEEELARPSREHGPKRNGTLPRPAERQPLRAATSTWVEAETVPDKGIWFGEEVRGLPRPLRLQPLKEPWGVYPGPMASHLGGVRKGSWKRSTALGTCSHGLARWKGHTSSFGVKRCPCPRELLVGGP